MTNTDKDNLAKALAHLYLIQSTKPVSLKEFEYQYKTFREILGVK